MNAQRRTGDHSFSLPRPRRDTLNEYRDTLAKLKARIRHIKEMTERYPVYLVFAGNGYRFESPSDVDRFIAELQREIQQFETESL